MLTEGKLFKHACHGVWGLINYREWFGPLTCVIWP